MKIGRKKFVFFASVSAAVLLVVVPAFIWIDRNLPMSIDFYNRTATSESAVWEWFHEKRDEMIRSRIERETSGLEINGTTWHDPETGATIQFGKDKVIRWIRRPQLLDPERFTFNETKAAALIDWLDGKAHDFQPGTAKAEIIWDGFGAQFGGDGNLRISPRRPHFQAGVAFNGHHLALWIRNTPPGQLPRSTNFIFDQRK